MKFGVPGRPHPVVVHVEAILELRAQADAKPDIEKAQARQRLEELEARLATLDTAIDVQTGSGNGPR